MIVYSATRAEFTADVYANVVEVKILAAFRQRFGRTTSKSEIASWKNSMQYMNNALVSSEVPGDAGVAIEYGIPGSAKRVDFILTGENEVNKAVAVIVELKQWSVVESTGKDAIVSTVIGGAKCEVLHPSYRSLDIRGAHRQLQRTVQNESIELAPCAYLHNCESDLVVNSTFYEPHTRRAPYSCEAIPMRFATSCGATSATAISRRSSIESTGAN